MGLKDTVESSQHHHVKEKDTYLGQKAVTSKRHRWAHARESDCRTYGSDMELKSSNAASAIAAL